MTPRTKAASPGMLDTLPNVCEFDSWFASVTPDYLAGFPKSFLVVCKGDQVFERSDCVVRSDPDIRRNPRRGCFSFIVRACLFRESVAVLSG